ncbi:Hypothetical predicted protein [Paramuricea clavata]|uniref:Uncharacterized protein n=1 Tax=Paramuricea clavata TaxID=317549 RepID=A0A7D9DCU7_PARCT|nr:Hypothetical predicted protein [Paramuricea clavata]
MKFLVQIFKITNLNYITKLDSSILICSRKRSGKDETRTDDSQQVLYKEY